jgi:UDP-N-acetylmuramoyl-tripeptide--D-alanyl-D-alanine ligase
VVFDSLTISELLRLDGLDARWRGNGPYLKDFSGISTDSRSIKKDELFFAINGENFDGHQYVNNALKSGARAAVVNGEWYEKNISFTKGLSVFTVKDTLFAFQEFARFYRQKHNVPAIAITGSAGKTSTKEFLASVLSTTFNAHSNIKSFNNHIGVPLTLYGLKKDHQLLVTEMGTNHFGELDRLSYLVGPSTCVFTNIGFAHLEFFKNLKGVTKAKMEMLNHQIKGGTTIINGDDPMLSSQDFLSSKIVTFGLSKKNDIVAENLKCDKNGFYTFKVKGTSIKLSIPGQHNVLNALAGVAVGLEYEVTMENIKKGIERVEPVEKRMKIYKDSFVTVIDDSYNGNPNSCQAALVTASDINVNHSGRKIAVLGDMLELGQYSKPEHRHLADMVKDSGVDTLFLFGRETKHTLMRAIEIGYFKLFYYEKMDDLVESLQNYVKPEDLVLVKGSRSMQMERAVKGLLEHLRKRNVN